MTPKIIFILGPPGSGKGTQCNKIVDKFNFDHYSAGELLRAEIRKPGSEYGEIIKKCLKDSVFVPFKITISLIERAINNSKHSKFLIDGFPVNQDNLDGWNRMMSDKTEIEFVLFLDCPEDVCINRCLERGAVSSGRTDDNIETLRKRFVSYTNDTMPIIKYYQGKNCVHRVDSSRSPDAVFDDITKIFKSL